MARELLRRALTRPGVRALARDVAAPGSSPGTSRTALVAVSELVRGAGGDRPAAEV
jgi:hypothetical protein